MNIILFGAFLLIYNLFKDNQKTKEEITQNLSSTRLNLLDDFEIIKQKEDWDLTYNRTNFILKICSDKDRSEESGRSIVPRLRRFRVAIRAGILCARTKLKV